MLFINFLLSERIEIVASKAAPLHMPSQHNYKPRAWQHNSWTPPGQGSAMEGALSSKDSPWSRIPIAWPLPGLVLIVAGTRPLKALRNSDCAPRARRNSSRGPRRLLFINFLLSERKEIVASKATPLRMPSQHNYKPPAWQHNSCSPPARGRRTSGTQA